MGLFDMGDGTIWVERDVDAVRLVVANEYKGTVSIMNLTVQDAESVAAAINSAAGEIMADYLQKKT